MTHLHIPDGVLPVWLWAAGWAVSLVALVIASRSSSDVSARRRVPLIAVVSAMMLVAMSSEIVPIAYHMNLTVIAGALLGPALSIIAAFIVEVALALLGHGGVTVLGLNTVIISSEMVIGWALVMAGIRVLGLRRIHATAFGATILTLLLSTTLLVGIVAIGGPAASVRETGALDPSTLSFVNPFAEGVFSLGLFSGGDHEDDAGEHEDEHAAGLSVERFAVVVYSLGAIGWALEGLVTAWVLGYIARVRPSLLAPGAALARRARPLGDEGVVT